jgi:hypothetical protein
VVRLASFLTVVLLGGGCSFDTAGGTVGGLSLGEGDEDGDGDASTGGSMHTADTSAGSADGDTSTPGPGTTGPGTSSTSGDTDEGGTTSAGTDADDDADTNDTASMYLAEVEISGAPTVEFGLLLLAGTQDEVLTVTNTGLGSASSLAALPLAAPFSFAGGGYPGSGGTCGAVLAAGDSCNLVVRFQPSAPATVVRELLLTYDPGDGSSKMVARDLRGGGYTANLVQNPIAANGLQGWEVVSGAWTSTCLWDVPPYEGNNCFTSALSTSGTVTLSGLRQDIAVDPWATEIDAGQVAVVVRARARSLSFSEGDPWRLRGAYRSGAQELAVFTDTGWQTTYAWTLVEDQQPVVTGTRVVRIRVDCGKPSGHEYCDAFFDAFEVILRPAD